MNPLTFLFTKRIPSLVNAASYLESARAGKLLAERKVHQAFQALQLSGFFAFIGGALSGLENRNFTCQAAISSFVAGHLFHCYTEKKPSEALLNIALCITAYVKMRPGLSGSIAPPIFILSSLTASSFHSLANLYQLRKSRAKDYVSYVDQFALFTLSVLGTMYSASSFFPFGENTDSFAGH